MGRKLLYAIAGAVLGCLVTAMCFRANRPERPYTPDGATTTTVTVYDTVPSFLPVARDSVVVRYEAHVLPVTGEGPRAGRDTVVRVDSVAVAVPITQKEYRDSTYRLWISGYAANLDSIETYTRHDHTTVTLAPQKTKRWHVGVTAGVAVTPKGVQPYVGCGMTYSFKTF